MKVENGAKLSFKKGSNISFTESTEIAPQIMKQLRKNSSEIFHNSSNDKEIDIFEIPTSDTTSVIIKFIDNLFVDKTKIIMFYEDSDKVANDWATLIDGYSDYGKSSIHHIKFNEDGLIYLTNFNVSFSADNPYAIDFKNDEKFSSDLIPNLSTAILMDKE